MPPLSFGEVESVMMCHPGASEGEENISDAKAIDQKGNAAVLQDQIHEEFS